VVAVDGGATVGRLLVAVAGQRFGSCSAMRQ
jgi:hypothetical protein